MMAQTSAKPRLRLRSLEPAEHDIQVSVAQTLTLEIAAPGRLSARGVVWFSVDHAHFAGVPGLRVGRGIIAGVPDVFLLYTGCAHFVELKRPEVRGESSHPVLSESQQLLLPVLATCGARLGVARSAFEVLALLDVWGVPRKGLIKDAA